MIARCISTGQWWLLLVLDVGLLAWIAHAWWEGRR